MHIKGPRSSASMGSDCTTVSSLCLSSLRPPVTHRFESLSQRHKTLTVSLGILNDSLVRPTSSCGAVLGLQHQAHISQEMRSQYTNRPGSQVSYQSRVLSSSRSNLRLQRVCETSLQCHYERREALDRLCSTQCSSGQELLRSAIVPRRIQHTHFLSKSSLGGRVVYAGKPCTDISPPQGLGPGIVVRVTCV